MDKSLLGMVTKMYGMFMDVKQNTELGGEVRHVTGEVGRG